MSELLTNLWIFLIVLSVKLKRLSNTEFLNLLKQLDYQQKVYAMWLRYFI